MAVCGVLLAVVVVVVGGVVLRWVCGFVGLVPFGRRVCVVLWLGFGWVCGWVVVWLVVGWLVVLGALLGRLTWHC